MSSHGLKNRQRGPPGRTFGEDYRTLSHRIFSLANRGVLRIDFMRKVLKMLFTFTECDAVELRLKERDTYYRCEFTDDPKASFHFEILPTMRDNKGKIIYRSHEDSDLERLCTDVIQGRIHPSVSLCTKSGSFWTGDAEHPVTLALTNDEQERIYNLGEHYRSLALIPFVIEEENIGLLQLNSKKKDFFSQDDIELYEGVAQTLGVALLDRRAQVALRERVKELTCLYGIAQLVAQPDMTIEKIMQGIVEILPPAWLYPDAAAARILFDGHSYTSSGFQQGCHRQLSDIMVDEEKRGTIEVTYSEEKPELDEGPFLREERNLLDTVAKEIGFVVIRKRAETESTKLQEQLRHADRLATIGQLAAGVAHELNEPLGNILGFAQLIGKDAQLAEQIRHDIERIEKASLHAREVIKKLMTFARQTPPQKGTVNVNRLVAEGLSFIESRCAKEGVELERILSPVVQEIKGDQSQLHQVLVNLVVNAIQAMPEGGKLTIRTTQTESSVVLIVEDTGSGMTEDVMRQIFVPFFTTKDVGQGTGLGLAVVHGIVTSHEGTINVESKVGHGTRFEVRLPVGEPHDYRKGD
ncbi:MAG: GAF domain-containing protein [Gemmatimonadota bacterium]|nr:MAG: GAF domain-containing protein [Gemmatimonadota bacterium]